MLLLCKQKQTTYVTNVYCEGKLEKQHYKMPFQNNSKLCLCSDQNPFEMFTYIFYLFNNTCRFVAILLQNIVLFLFPTNLACRNKLEGMKMMYLIFEACTKSG